MAPTLKETILSLLPRETPSLGSAEGPLAEHFALLSAVSKRDDDENDRPDPSSGVLDPHDISNVGFFVLFALIGVAFIVTGIWFFFWAKNGGFYFKETDWDDYKTTVLRRKGPNGTLLSGATESTNLGGGSVYKDVADEESTVYNAGYARFGRKDGKDDDDRTVFTEGTAMSGITAGPSDIGAREKRKQKKEMRERERERKRREKKNTEKEARSSKRHVGENGVEDEEAERAAKKELRSYRHEKSARVGGLNKESEGSQWDGSTNPTDSTVSSNLLSNRQSTPTSTPTKDGNGIRKVYSTADKVEAERLKQEARRRRREEREAAGSPGARTSRRDFSYQRSVVGSDSALTESLLEGSGVSEETGTKSYHHPRPELRAQRQKEREERRERRKGGYRRGRGEDDDEL